MANLKATLLGSIIGDVLMSEGRVSSARELGPFRHIEVHAPSLRSLGEPGDKIQVYMPDVGARTYTPFAFDQAARTFQLLALARHESPGSRWARTLQSGATLRFIGPSGSIDLKGLRTPVALFGDETSLAVARALQDLRGNRTRIVLEVDDLEATRAAAEALGLPHDGWLKRAPNDDHLREAARQLASYDAHGSIVLTGRASSIQRVRKELRELRATANIKTRAYWADGKRGLD